MQETAEAKALRSELVRWVHGTVGPSLWGVQSEGEDWKEREAGVGTWNFIPTVMIINKDQICE